MATGGRSSSPPCRQSGLPPVNGQAVGPLGNPGAQFGEFRGHGLQPVTFLDSQPFSMNDVRVALTQGCGHRKNGHNVRAVRRINDSSLADGRPADQNSVFKGYLAPIRWRMGIMALSP